MYKVVDNIMRIMSRTKAIKAGPVVTGNGLPTSGAGSTLVKVRSR